MNQQQYEDEIDIVDYIKVIYRRWKMIVIVVLAAMLLAGIFSLLKPKMYEASATFFPMNVREYYSSSSEAVGMKRRLNIENLIVSLLESRKMADRIIEQLNLKNLWETKLISDTQNALKGATKTSMQKNGIIKVSVQTISPKLSAKIANAYVDNLDYFNRELELGAQRQIVQVIDRASVPEKRMSRGTKKNILLAGVVSFMFAVFLTFFLDFVQRSNIWKRLGGE